MGNNLAGSWADAAARRIDPRGPKRPVHGSSKAGSFTRGFMHMGNPGVLGSCRSIHSEELVPLEPDKKCGLLLLNPTYGNDGTPSRLALGKLPLQGVEVVFVVAACCTRQMPLSLNISHLEHSKRDVHCALCTFTLCRPVASPQASSSSSPGQWQTTASPRHLLRR